MIAERRQHPRVKLDVDVQVGSGSNFYTGRASDISVGGVFVSLPFAPEVGTEVAISLHIGRRKLDIVARCAWVLTSADGGPAGFGADFVTIGPGALRAIEAFTKKQDPLVFEMLEDTQEEAPAPARAAPPKGPPPLPR